MLRLEYIRLKFKSFANPFETGHAFDKKGQALITQVIRPDGHRVTGNIAAAKPSFFQNCNIGNAVVFGKVMGGGKAMPARANDQNVIFFSKWQALPVARPVTMMAQRIPGKANGGKPTH
jgi:hypothetical protein